MESDSALSEVQGVKVYSFISRLVDSGATPAEIRQHLIEAGVDMWEATRLTDRLAESQTIEKLRAHAAALLAQGAAPDQIKPMLIAEGFPEKLVAEEVAALAVEQIVDEKQAREDPSQLWRLIGGVLLVVGLVLFVGNRSGLLPTFPFAGGVLITVGTIALLMSKLPH